MTWRGWNNSNNENVTKCRFLWRILVFVFSALLPCRFFGFRNKNNVNTELNAILKDGAEKKSWLFYGCFPVLRRFSFYLGVLRFDVTCTDCSFFVFSLLLSKDIEIKNEIHSYPCYCVGSNNKCCK